MVRSSCCERQRRGAVAAVDARPTSVRIARPAAATWQSCEVRCDMGGDLRHSHRGGPAGEFLKPCSGLT